MKIGAMEIALAAVAVVVLYGMCQEAHATVAQEEAESQKHREIEKRMPYIVE